MAVWDPERNRTIENYRHLIRNQSIVSLAWDRRSGLLFGGSGNFGGGGTRPQEKEALFFAFDPVTKKKTFEAAFVPGARSYPATLAASGRIYTTAGDTLLIVDPETKSVRKRLQLPGAQVEIALGLDEDKSESATFDELLGQEIGKSLRQDTMDIVALPPKTPCEAMCTSR